MLKIDKEVFERNLLLTQTYCEMQLANTDKSTAEILRSFNPEYGGKPIFSFGNASYKQYHWSETTWNVDPLSGSQNALYKELFEKQLIHKLKGVENNFTEQLYQGKIFVAAIDETVVDGASECASDGLIDGNDCPPIDTWFYITNDEHGDILFAWIPEKYIKWADDAINVNCVDCLGWYDDVNYFEERNKLYLRVPKYSKAKNGWLATLIKNIKSKLK